MGNPSDLYKGIVIASTLNDFSVKGSLKQSHEFEFKINNSLDSELHHLGIKTIEFLVNRGFEVSPLTFSITTNIPKSAGLGGSAAIIINFLLLLNDRYTFNLNLNTIAHYATLIEHEELGIVAGPQDRVIITYGGALYMDFTSPDYRNYEIHAVDIDSLPFWIGIRSKSVSSGDMHRFAYDAFPHNPELQKIVEQLKLVAIRGKKAIDNHDVDQLGQLMWENQHLTSLYGKYGKPNRDVLLQRRIDDEIFTLCREQKTYGAKLTGSSGSVIVLSEEPPDFLLEYEPSTELEQQLSEGLHGSQISSVVRLKAGKRRTSPEE